MHEWIFEIFDFQDFSIFGSSLCVFGAVFGLWRCAAAQFQNGFFYVYMACRAGIKRYRLARRVILLVAVGNRAPTVSQNSNFLVGFAVIALDLHIRF